MKEAESSLFDVSKTVGLAKWQLPGNLPLMCRLPFVCRVFSWQAILINGGSFQTAYN